jgi:hypothetical protein
MVESAVSAGATVIALVWLAGLVAGTAHAEPFTFAGFNRNMDIAVLIDRYPRSSREFTPGTEAPGRGAEDNPREWARELLRAQRTGRYALRLTPEESPDHVYYVQADMREGSLERLWLLLERPLVRADRRHPTRSNEARYPVCNDVLKPLTMRYGKPDALAPRWEEALESFDYVWTQAPEAMKLECGRYDGRKTEFAIGVTFEQTPPR